MVGARGGQGKRDGAPLAAVLSGDNLQVQPNQEKSGTNAVVIFNPGTHLHEDESKLHSIDAVGNIGQIRAKNEIRPPSHTTHKNKLKMDQRHKRETQNHKNAKRRHKG